MKKRVADIADLVGRDVAIDIAREPIDGLLHGFLAGVSEKLLLLHEIDGDDLQLNGYAAVRIRDVRSYCVDETFVTRALRLLERKLVLPQGIDLSGWSGLLATAQIQYPLIMIETEKKEPGIAFIGRVAKVAAHHVVLEKLNARGKWGETERFAYKDITQVGFDSGYVNALAFVPYKIKSSE